MSGVKITFCKVLQPILALKKYNIALVSYFCLYYISFVKESQQQNAKKCENIPNLMNEVQKLNKFLA